MDSGEGGGDDFADAHERKGKVTVLGAEGCLAFGESGSATTSHAWRDDDVAFAMPELYGDPDVLQTKPPRAGIQATVPGWAAATRAEGFGGAFGESVQ